MSESDLIKLFILNNLAIEAGLTRVRVETGLSAGATAVELAADKLISPYVEQFDFALHTDSGRMAEYYKLFYMLENDIRRMVSDALSNENPLEWWSKLVPAAVQASAKRNRDREVNEGVSLRSENMIEYTTFGELGEIIKHNWNIFAGIFSSASILSLEKILSRLNTLRGPIAHCGVLSEDEVLRLKLTVRDWFRLME